jgi:hypothetical protein
LANRKADLKAYLSAEKKVETMAVMKGISLVEMKENLLVEAMVALKETQLGIVRVDTKDEMLE